MLSKGESERTEELNTLYFTETHRAEQGGCLQPQIVV